MAVTCSAQFGAAGSIRTVCCRPVSLRVYPYWVVVVFLQMPSYKRPGYETSKDDLLARLRRVKGQVGGVERMVEDERYCIDVLTQISAVQAALDKVALGLLDEHARHCIVEAEGSERPERAEELMTAVGRLVRR